MWNARLKSYKNNKMTQGGLTNHRVHTIIQQVKLNPTLMTTENKGIHETRIRNLIPQKYMDCNKLFQVINFNILNLYKENHTNANSYRSENNNIKPHHGYKNKTLHHTSKITKKKTKIKKPTQKKTIIPKQKTKAKPQDKKNIQYSIKCEQSSI